MDNTGWPASFRSDQVFAETTPADKLDMAIANRRYDLCPPPRRWFQKKQPALPEAQIELEIAMAQMASIEYRRNNQPINVASDIITETDDGLSLYSKVLILVSETRDPAKGRFIAEFRNLRYVIFDSGAKAAYPIDKVISLKP